MADLSGEFSTPLYLFISCLTAAWLLPHRWRIIARIICMVFILLYVLIQFSYIGYYMTTKALLSANMMIAMAQTNISEAISYMEVNLPYAGLAGGIIALILLGALVFLISRYSFHQEEIVSKRPGLYCFSSSLRIVGFLYFLSAVHVLPMYMLRHIKL